MSVPIGMASSSVFVDGLRITYTAAGTGSPAIVFIHGAFEDESYFAPALERLAARRRVIAVTLRGHGDSDVPDSVSIDDFARDVAAASADAGVESAILVGHSVLGAAIAFAVADARPDLVRAIAVLDAVVFPAAGWRASMEGLLQALEGDDWLDALQHYFARTLDEHDPAGLRARVMGDIGRIEKQIASDLVRCFLAADIGASMEAASCPQLYVHAHAPADLARLGRSRPDVLVGQVVGSGHYLMLVVPDQLAAMLDRFVELVDERDTAPVLRG